MATPTECGLSKNTASALDVSNALVAEAAHQGRLHATCTHRCPDNYSEAEKESYESAQALELDRIIAADVMTTIRHAHFELREQRNV